AEKQFDAFMAAYPTSKLAPNALYWKAECLYLRGKYADALFVFKDVTARYPKHPKAADALLKAGMSYARLGDADSAKLHYRVLYEDYPTSQAAKTGKKLGLNP
ncbi:MAG: tol-pal system protein YbgF, partial [Bilophila sp.]